MVDEEVENILLEIRERVRTQEAAAPAGANSTTGNGARESSTTSSPAMENSSAEALARVEAHLTTTSRAWDRLPPLVSNRSGGMARLELWLKSQLKRSTRWFAWEQINFNAAVHHALQDILEAQRAANHAYEQTIENLRAESESQRAMLEKNQALLMSQLVSQREEIEALQEKIAAQRSQLEGQRAQAGAQRAQMEAQINARLSELANEIRERDVRSQEEQRVCFKQLSLEATEAAVLEDRARRKTETLLEELRRRLEQLEKQ